MNAPSLVGRLVRLQQTIVVVVLLAFAGSALWWTARTLARQDVLDLRNAATHIAANLAHEWEEDPALTADAAAQASLEEEGNAGIDFEIRGASGAALASTFGSRRPPGPRREVVVAAPRGLQVSASRSTKGVRDALAAMAIAFAMATVPIVVVTFAWSRALARRALLPLSRMTVAADEASRHGVTLALRDERDPAEVARLGAAFDRLTARLDARAESERQFAEDAAHELRTPLTGLSGELELALADPALSAMARDALMRAGARARAMHELVDALLLLRRAEQGVLDPARVHEPVNLADVARDVAEEVLRQHASRRSDLRLVREDEVLVRGDFVLLGAAIRNLLANAVQFTVAGQPVVVTVAQDAAEAVVRVEDGGPGVAEADRERVFDPFFRGATARASHDGFGLGLPILRRVARAHRGDVRLGESPLGGAAFELRIPSWGA